MKIKIAVDAMGGDLAPKEIVEGAKDACRDNQNIEIILVGRPEKVEPFLVQKKASDNNALKQIELRAADQTIGMHESAAMAVKTKKDSSIVVGLELVKNDQADAFISAGNTGAVMAAALLKLGRIKGIQRPAIAVTIPTSEKPIVLIDAGANLDCKPANLVQFALMGTAFSEKVLGVKNPKVGLLNVGSEKGKGTETVKAAHDLLENAPIDFFGNVEGRDVTLGTADVVVCDGFVGNIVLKSLEGLASVMFNEIKDVINATTVNKVGGLLLARSLKKLKHRLSQDTYGAAELLGVNGICLISHGSSNRNAIKNSIMTAETSVKKDIIQKIQQEVQE
ncbi:hypothetical protein LCGC14_0753270 [marine sediment metagenome]|uniref:phosphate acyltransferase n=1 Tax=marine sediment metagenome TaxID=412755 RepID=A0A0F9Q3C9_9ZZZZ